MRILVLGASGMAGHVISIFLREAGHDVHTHAGHNKLDKDTELVEVTDLDKLEKVLDQNRYDVVVNCVGILVKKSDARKDLSTFINSFLPHFLENKYKDSPTKLIHLSTDCVFSGKNPPYYEESPYDGELFYDRTKALGEVINKKDLTFRMSIIGPDMQESGVGLFNWFFGQSGEISGYTTAIWSGITTIELSRGIQAALEQNLTGLYHLVPSNNISKFELLKIFKTIFDRDDINVKAAEDVVSDKTLINTRKDFKFEVGDYQKMISEMKKWIINHQSLYGHYKLGST